MDKQLRLFLNKRHESSIMQKYDKGNNCESLKTSKIKEISLFLRLPHLGNISLQIKKEIRQNLIKTFLQNFDSDWYTILTILANASNLKIVKPYYAMQELYIN